MNFQIGKHIHVWGWWRTPTSRKQKLLYLGLFQISPYVLLNWVFISTLYNKPVNISRASFWVLWFILASGEIWRENHGNPRFVARLHWESTTCDWCLKSRQSWGTESLTCRVYLVSELSWLVGHPVGVHRELIVGDRKHSGAKIPPAPTRTASISTPPYPFLWLSNYSALIVLYLAYCDSSISTITAKQ